MTDNRTTELQSLSKLKMAGKLHYWRGTIEMPETELHAICDEIQAEHEQAIAATLGVGECAQCAKDMGAYADSLCDPLKERINKLLRCLENDWHISASWDGLRKFWCIELTEEGVRIRDGKMAHGTLTAEQVRKCVRVGACDHGLWDAVDEDTDWQAIADELNEWLRGKAVKR